MDFRLVIISMSINLDFKCTMLHISETMFAYTTDYQCSMNCTYNFVYYVV